MEGLGHSVRKGQHGWDRRGDVLASLSLLGKKMSFNRRVLHTVLHNQVFQLAWFITRTLEWRHAVLPLNYSSHLTCSKPSPDITDVRNLFSLTLIGVNPQYYCVWKVTNVSDPHPVPLQCHSRLPNYNCVLRKCA